MSSSVKTDIRERFGFSSKSTGGHMGRSMMLHEMTALVASLGIKTTKDEISSGVLDENLLGKPTLSSRKESLFRLTQIYGLDSNTALFRTLWKFGHDDPLSLPQLCLVCAYARDAQLRHSFGLIRSMKPGELLHRADMEHYIEEGFPGRFSDGMKASMARNVNATWTFSGHLAGKKDKVRSNPEPRPTSATYAMFVGYLLGLRGENLLSSEYAALVSSNRAVLTAALSLASSRGLLALKQAGGVVEFDFSNLLTLEEQAWLNESN